MKQLPILILLLFGYILIAQNRNVSSDSLGLDISEDHTNSFESVPIYKGCDNKSSNTDLKQCMSEKISELFARNFNTTLHKDSNLTAGSYQVQLIFKIDINGNVKTIRARGGDSYLEEEAIRVAKLIPIMQPGKIKGKAVVVPYSVPLKIQMVKPTSKADVLVYPRFRGCNENLEYQEAEKCSKEKISNFIKLNFDVEMASMLFPNDRSTQFQVDFIINEKGKIEKVNAKANHKAVAIEAIKVAKRLPKFKSPGLLNGKPVKTPFSLLMTVYFL